MGEVGSTKVDGTRGGVIGWIGIITLDARRRVVARDIGVASDNEKRGTCTSLNSMC